MENGKLVEVGQDSAADLIVPGPFDKKVMLAREVGAEPVGNDSFDY